MQADKTVYIIPSDEFIPLITAEDIEKVRQEEVKQEDQYSEEFMSNYMFAWKNALENRQMTICEKLWEKRLKCGLHDPRNRARLMELTELCNEFAYQHEVEEGGSKDYEKIVLRLREYAIGWIEFVCASENEHRSTALVFLWKNCIDFNNFDACTLMVSSLERCWTGNAKLPGWIVVRMIRALAEYTSAQRVENQQVDSLTSRLSEYLTNC